MKKREKAETTAKKRTENAIAWTNAVPNIRFMTKIKPA